MLRRDRRARTAVVVPVAAVVASVLVLLPDRLGLDRWLPFAVFPAFRPALLVVAVLGLVVAAVVLLSRRRTARRRTARRRTAPRPAVLATAAVAVVVVVSGAPVVARAVPDPLPPSRGGEVTVLALNVYEGRADPDVLADTVRREQPDLVVLPEAGERYRTLMAARLPSYRSWTNVPPGARDVRGIVVLAAPRAGDVRAQRLSGATRYPWVEVTAGILGATRLVGVHLVSPVPGWIRYWPDELASLRRWCADDAATMVVGDLNATADHSAFRTGTAGCSDAADERGAGLTATWPTRSPRWLGAQIDHVLLTGGPVAREVRVFDVPGTDHRGLVVALTPS